jgi:hypothetical protein
MRDAKQHIQRLLRMNDQEYHDLVFHYAYLWIAANFINDIAAEQVLVQGSQFWVWWTSQYDLRDKRFWLTELSGKLWLTDDERLKLRLRYERMHSPLALAIWPNKKVMHETYQICISNMITHVVREETTV